MHLLPVYYTTTSSRKRKKQKKSKSLLAAEQKHAKYLKKMRVNSRSSVGLEQRPSKPWVTGSSPVESTNNKGGCSSVGRAGALQASGQEFNSPHLHQDQFYHKSSAKPEPNVYSGERRLIGIATMHKSNSVPIFEDNKELATEIAKMRR